MKTTAVVKIDPKDPDLSKIRDIARECKSGKIVAFPMDAHYGMGAPMSAPGIGQQLQEIKNQDPESYFSYHIGELEMLDYLDVVLTPEIRFLTKKFWPGPLTLVVKNKKGEPISIRYPNNRLAAALITASSEPFIATSAKTFGKNLSYNAQDVMAQLNGQLDFLVDGGKTELAEDVTVVDMTGSSPVILSKGAMAGQIEEVTKKIEAGKFPRKKVLFVCTGNSCRTPMAEGLFRSEIRRKGLLDQIEISSCGIGARNGASATPEAVLVMKNREIDISSHRAKICTRQEVSESDIIYAMSVEHQIFISGLMPMAKSKIRVWDIPDPIGMGIMIYEEVVRELEKKIREAVKEVVG